MVVFLCLSFSFPAISLFNGADMPKFKMFLFCCQSVTITIFCKRHIFSGNLLHKLSSNNLTVREPILPRPKLDECEYIVRCHELTVYLPLVPMITSWQRQRFLEANACVYATVTQDKITYYILNHETYFSRSAVTRSNLWLIVTFQLQNHIKDLKEATFTPFCTKTIKPKAFQ